MKNWLPYVPLIGALLTFIGPQILQIIGWLIKQRENGRLASENIALKQIDVDEAGKRRMLDDNDRLREEADELKSRVGLLEERETERLRRDLQVEVVLRAMNADLTELTVALAAFVSTAELRSVERLARSLQSHVQTGLLAIGKGA